MACLAASIYSFEPPAFFTEAIVGGGVVAPRAWRASKIACFLPSRELFVFSVSASLVLSSFFNSSRIS
jgi:hypothetical protein